MQKVIVVTAVHNRYEVTKNYISNLVNQSYKNWSLLLIDDGSIDGTDKMVLNTVKNAKILYGNGDLWWAGALQLAYEWLIDNASDEEIIFISNDDINIPNDFIERSVDILNKSSNSILVATGINIESNSVGDSPMKNNYVNFKGIKEVYDGTADCASTRAIFIKVKDLKTTGGFRPKLLPHYGSDYEFTIRAHRKGLKIISDRNLEYKYSDKTSGYHTYFDEKPRSFFKKMFSKKSAYNPIYGITFIMLTTPFYILPFAIIYKLFRYCRNIIRYVYHRIKTIIL